jgi:drug/metabolite transporter (DMT)-like permease
MTDNLRGIAAILASASGFVVNDAIVKLVTEELPTGELIVVRGLMATVLIGAVAWWRGAMRPVRVLLQTPIIIRILAAALATLFIVGALRYLPLATCTAILQVSPLAVTAGSALLLGAGVGWRRWTASLVGLAGVLLIIRPGAEGINAHVWIALAALLFASARDLTTRFIDPSVPSLYVAFASSVLIMLGGFVLLPMETWVVPSPKALLLLALASAAVFFGYYLGIVAMRVGEIAVVAPFRYSTILLALLLGYLLWGFVPDAISLAGIAIVIGSGLYLLRRERAVLARQRATATVTEGPST